MQKKINIKDVAARAGVHPSTVSRVLNPATHSMVSQAVGERILKIAEEMGYARSPMASGLRTGRSYTIGVMIPDLLNPVFPPIVRGIERTLAEDGYIAILADSDNNTKSERAILDSMKARHVDGLILATAHRKDSVVDSCIEDDIPVVLVNRTTDSHEVTAVINDDALGIRLAVDHLLALGHRSIAFMGGPQNTSTGRERYVAFRNLWKKGHFRSDSTLILNGKSYNEQAGKAGMQKILRSQLEFTAVVTANDLLALGCYDALGECHLSCPRDISITGFNDMPFMDRLSSPLTTLRIPHDEIGVRAARLLLSRILHSDKTVTTVSLEPELIVRGSTASPAKA
ncbi:LacI family DNA-binding transcriptional regulator [Pseudomonadota bacterium]